MSNRIAPITLEQSSATTRPMLEAAMLGLLLPHPLLDLVEPAVRRLPRLTELDLEFHREEPDTEEEQEV